MVMKKMVDLTGQRFGRLIVVSKSEFRGKNRNSFWNCVCDCGNTKTIELQSLKSGKTKSCGCLHNELQANRKKKHGLCNHRLYGIWTGMKQRCTNPKRNGYKHYGGKGITVCQEWFDFPAFYLWATANGYTEKLTLDRINPDGNYCPENCQWIPEADQNRNKTNNRLITAQGKTMLLCDWAKILGIRASVILNRIQSGWTETEAVTTPLQK
jgi:hypothetical protein